jgi:hypothetical protein
VIIEEIKAGPRLITLQLASLFLMYICLNTPHIIRVIKSRRTRRAMHVARMEAIRCACKILVGKLEGKRPLQRSRL